MVLFVVAPLIGCAAPANSYCQIASPIRWDTQTQLDQTPTSIVRQIVTHNEQWAALCKTS